jgi:hypothetical protein
MKTTALLLLCFTLTANFCSGQNLVPNPSFEEYDTCPDTWGRVSFLLNWTIAANSPDYYSACSTTDAISPPSTGFGYQQPHSGNGYVGISVFDRDVQNYREVVSCDLVSPLDSGNRYYFAFYTNLGGAYTLAADKIGLLFSTSEYSVSNPAPINNFSHYYTSTIISDTANWVKVAGSFIADSGYQYMLIGNFYDDFNTDTVGVGSLNINSYYFIDDVCLSTDSAFVSTWEGQPTNLATLYNTDAVIFYPNPTTEDVYLHANRKPIDVSVIDYLGRIVFYTNSIDDNRISLSNLETGVYSVRVRFLQGVYSNQLHIIH